MNECTPVKAKGHFDVTTTAKAHLAIGDSAQELEDQYDPNQDFAIFGIGDKTKGGI